MPTTYGEHEGYINKVIYDDTVLIDISQDDVTAADVLSGVHFHLPTGAPAQGSCTYNADVSSATATASSVLSGQTFFSGTGSDYTIKTGSMTNRGSVTGTITTKAQEYTIPQGYHDGGGKVSISSTEQAKIIATNIREGITILGVLGTMSGSENMHAESVTYTPTAAGTTITPTSPTYNCISQVVVNAIPYTETLNSAGGYTASIACTA